MAFSRKTFSLWGDCLVKSSCFPRASPRSARYQAVAAGIVSGFDLNCRKVIISQTLNKKRQALKSTMHSPSFVTMPISWWPVLFPLPATPTYPNSNYLNQVSTGVDRNSPTGIPWLPTRSCRFTRKALAKASMPGRRSLLRPLFTSIAVMLAPARRTKSTS